MVLIEGFTVVDEAREDQQDVLLQFYEETAFAQTTVAEFKNGPLVGVEFVVEVRNDSKARSSRNCSYLCAICGLKVNAQTLTAHINSVPHKVKFTEVLCPELFKKYGNNKSWEPQQVKEFCDALEKVELKLGRKRLAVCLDKDKKNVLKALRDFKESTIKKHESSAKKPSSKSSDGKHSSRGKTSDTTNKSSSSSKRTRSPARRSPTSRRPRSPAKSSGSNRVSSLRSRSPHRSGSPAEEKSSREKFFSERKNTTAISLQPRPAPSNTQLPGGNNRSDFQTGGRRKTRSPDRRKAASPFQRRFPNRRSRSPLASRQLSPMLRGRSPLNQRTRSPPSRMRLSPPLTSRSPLRGHSPSRTGSFGREECEEELEFPQNQYPDLDFVRMIVGPRGSTVQRFENDFNVTISLCGKGYRRSKNKCNTGKLLHAHVIGKSAENVRRAISKMRLFVDYFTRTEGRKQEPPPPVILPTVSGVREEIIKLPFEKYPEVDFLTFIRGQHGETIDKLQWQTGTTVSLRGKTGSVEDPPHVFVKAHNDKDCWKAVNMIDDLIGEAIGSASKQRSSRLSTERLPGKSKQYGEDSNRFAAESTTSMMTRQMPEFQRNNNNNNNDNFSSTSGGAKKLYGLDVCEVARLTADMSSIEALKYITKLLYLRGYSDPNSGEVADILKAVGAVRRNEENKNSRSESGLDRMNLSMPKPSVSRDEREDKRSSNRSRDFDRYNRNTRNETTFDSSIVENTRNKSGGSDWQFEKNFDAAFEQISSIKDEGTSNKTNFQNNGGGDRFPQNMNQWNSRNENLPREENRGKMFGHDEQTRPDNAAGHNRRIPQMGGRNDQIRSEANVNDENRNDQSRPERSRNDDKVAWNDQNRPDWNRNETKGAWNEQNRPEWNMNENKTSWSEQNRPERNNDNNHSNWNEQNRPDEEKWNANSDQPRWGNAQYQQINTLRDDTKVGHNPSVNKRNDNEWNHGNNRANSPPRDPGPTSWHTHFASADKTFKENENWKEEEKVPSWKERKNDSAWKGANQSWKEKSDSVWKRGNNDRQANQHEGNEWKANDNQSASNNGRKDQNDSWNVTKNEHWKNKYVPNENANNDNISEFNSTNTDGQDWRPFGVSNSTQNTNWGKDNQNTWNNQQQDQSFGRPSDTWKKPGQHEEKPRFDWATESNGQWN